MKFINKLPKKTRIISLMILLVMVSATTIAFLQDYTNTLTNSFSIKSIHTEIEENNHSSSLTKIPFVENTDVTDVMVRIKLDVSGNIDDLFPNKFVLAGFDENYKYAIGSDGFSSIQFDETAVNSGYYKSGELTRQYWERVGNNPYSCYYYYKNVLKASGTTKTIDENEQKKEIRLDATQPLFDRILLKVGDNDYISYDQADEAQKEEFAALENVTITIYQESVPLTVTKEDGTVLKVEYDSNGQITGFDNKNSDTFKIWDYFMNSPTTSN